MLLDYSVDERPVGVGLFWLWCPGNARVVSMTSPAVRSLEGLEGLEGRLSAGDITGRDLVKITHTHIYIIQYTYIYIYVYIYNTIYIYVILYGV